MDCVSTLDICCIFFFSSRRRHTRFKCDWSSDVCSSDLPCTRLWSEEETHMATSVQRANQLTMAELKGKVDPDWCPGCGDFGVLAALQKALVELQIPTHNVVTISGIGCSSNLPGYINNYD